MPPETYRFGAFELDEGLYQLRRDGLPVKLEPKVFDMLLTLVRHRDRVVSKDELLDRLWPGEAVSESVLPTNVAAVRRILRADPRSRDAVQTVHGRGYRFVAAVEAGPAATRPLAPEPARRPFVGRESELQTLRGALDAALAGEGRLELLMGEPGIGKTRTLDELAGEARRRGLRVLTGRCYEGEGAPAFWPWVQVLRDAWADLGDGDLARTLGAGAAEVAELLPELRERLPDLAPAPGGTPEQARFRLFDAVTRFLVRESARRPLAILLDDLHWADKPSLLLLQFLATELGGSRMLVAGTYRDVELRRTHPLAQIVADLAREPSCDRVPLRGLDRAAVARFLEMAGPSLDASLADEAFEMTEGNPFFLGEIVELWKQAKGRRPRSSGATLPQGAREAIGRRLDSLSDECNRVLRLASVIGREFGITVLERLAELPAEELLARLDEARAARVVEEPAGVGAYRFAHLLIRETLYEEITTPERVRLHRRVAEILETLHGAESEVHAAELAHHYFQGAPGGDVARAISLCERAAERAMRVLAYEESAVHLERALLALDLAAPVDEVHRCRLLLALAHAQDHAGEFRTSSRIGERAFEVAHELDRPDLLARAALAVAGRFDFGPPYAQGCRHLEEALAALGEAEPHLRCKLLARLAVTSPHRDSMETRLALAEQAVALARELGDPDTLLDALAGLGYPGLLGPDHDARRLEVAAEVEELANRTGRRDMLGRVHEDRMRSYLAAGDIDAAAREVDAARVLAESLRQPAMVYFTSFFRVARAIAEARFDDAEREIRSSHAEGLRVGRWNEASAVNVDGIYLFQVFAVLQQKGELAGMPADLHEYTPDPNFAPALIEAAVAVIREATGAVEQARGALDRIAARGFDAIPRDEWWLGTLALLTQLVAALGDAPRARELYDLLLPYASRNLTFQLFRLYAGSTSRFLGLLAETFGDLDAAARHCADALEANARMGARGPSAWTQLGYARVLLVRAGAGDGEAARELLTRCLATARSCGMSGLETSAAPLAERAH
jgi:DNA-binding winged helix-turn-helix (wHTH) protein/tetratricopeptide (TPR) repeat protein